MSVVVLFFHFNVCWVLLPDTNNIKPKSIQLLRMRSFEFFISSLDERSSTAFKFLNQIYYHSNQFLHIIEFKMFVRCYGFISLSAVEESNIVARSHWFQLFNLTIHMFTYCNLHACVCLRGRSLVCMQPQSGNKYVTTECMKRKAESKWDKLNAQSK